MCRITRLGIAWCGIVAQFCWCTATCGLTTKYANFDELAEAARLARAGDVLLLKSGHYRIDEAVTLAAGEGGSEDQPLIIRAETSGGVVLTGDSTAFAFKPGASHVVVSGFVFQLQDETAVKMDGANHIRVTRCVFQLRETDSFDWLVITGAHSRHNRVDRCLFADKVQPGNFITIDGDSQGQQSQYDRIDHNYFRDNGPRVTNEKEAVRVGWSEVSLSSGFTVVEYNYFERCDGDPEIISIKSCDNTVRYNTISDSAGVLSLRHGNRSSVHGNVILGAGRAGCGGIRIYGDDHRVYNNYLANLTGERFDAALALTNGDKDDAQPGGRLDAHFRPRRIEIVNNSLISNAHSIEIGYTSSSKKPWRKAPQAILLANNLVTGRETELVKIYTPPDTCWWKNNLFWPTGSADVGPVPAESASITVSDPDLQQQSGLLVPALESPAVDAGLPCPYVKRDLAGIVRGPAPDLGALEAASSIVPRAPRTALDVGPDAPEAKLEPPTIVGLNQSLQNHLPPRP